MANQRYDLRKEPDGTWTVFEIATGQPVVVSGMLSTGLTGEEADDLVDLLNYRSSKGDGDFEGL